MLLAGLGELGEGAHERGEQDGTYDTCDDQADGPAPVAPGADRRQVVQIGVPGRIRRGQDRQPPGEPPLGRRPCRDRRDPLHQPGEPGQQHAGDHEHGHEDVRVAAGVVQPSEPVVRRFSLA